MVPLLLAAIRRDRRVTDLLRLGGAAASAGHVDGRRSGPGYRPISLPLALLAYRTLPLAAAAPSWPLGAVKKPPAPKGSTKSHPVSRSTDRRRLPAKKLAQPRPSAARLPPTRAPQRFPLLRHSAPQRPLLLWALQTRPASVTTSRCGPSKWSRHEMEKNLPSHFHHSFRRSTHSASQLDGAWNHLDSWIRCTLRAPRQRVR